MKKALEAFCFDIAAAGGVPRGPSAVSALTGGSDAFLALFLACRGEGRLVLAVTGGIPDADRLAADLEMIAAAGDSPAHAARILELPVKLEGDSASVGVRLKTISALRAWSIKPYPAVVVAPFAALAPAVSCAGAESIVLDMKSGGAPDLSALVSKLSAFGYRRVPSVESEGDFSVRGGILDVWSPGEEFPVRAEFFGDEIESLRTFNAATQLSVEKISSCSFLSLKDAEESAGRTVSVLDLMPEGSCALLVDHNSYNLDLSPVFTGECV